jgi:hypothetical protein
MAEGAGHLMLKLTSTNHPCGVQSVRHSFVNTPSVVSAKPRDCYARHWWWIT